MRAIARKVQNLCEAALGKELFVEVDVSCPKERFGSAYGGWDIVTSCVNANSMVYSFGVGEDASFDTPLMDRFNLVIHAFDPTPKSIEWFKRQDFSENFKMHEYGLAGFDRNTLFNPPENPEHVSHTLLSRPSTQHLAITVPVKRLSTIMKELDHDRIDILKMDIEGAEYEAIDDMSNGDIRPKQILVELHHRFAGVGVKQS